MAIPDPLDRAYDALPYESHAQAETHLDVLATQASVFGMKPAPPSRCRALFLGCASGWNVLPMAAQWPESRFVGVDRSERQVLQGRADASLLGLENVELLPLDMLELPEELGEYDYIVAHGVYSWVPAEVQAAILAICRRHLAPQGVAYISYNCKPGWAMRSLMRDMMLHHARGHDAPQDQVRQARAMLSFLGRAAKAGQKGGYAGWLQGEVDLLGRMGDFYLLHEHLTPANEALWFVEFVERARDKGLQYMGEPTLAMMLDRGLPGALRRELDAATPDLIQMQQYLDFARGRHFRRSLLVHDELTLDRGLDWRTLMPLRVASPARSSATDGALDDASEVAFERDGGELASTSPLLKRALHGLGAAWPASVPFVELVEQALAAVGATISMEQAQRILGRDLLNATASGFVDLSLGPNGAGKAGEFPRTSPLVRLQAERGWSLLTTGHHRPLAADATMRTLVRLCDGSRDEAAITEQMVAATRAGELDGALAVASEDEATLRRAVAGVVVRTLAEMEASAMFVCP